MAPPQWPEWVCPVHAERLELCENKLHCVEGDYFPIRNGIPRFVTGDGYCSAFGVQWRRYRLYQLDSFTGSSSSRDRARRCLGEELWATLASKQVLECGCGAGRFTEVLLNGGAYVTSIDLSSAVDANEETCPQGMNHRIAQADILALPFPPERFDIVFCLGVIQHTPEPEKTISSLYEQVKPGGSLVFDHYTHNLFWYTKTAPLFRQVLRRLPPEKGVEWTEKIARIFLPLHERVRDFRLAQMLLSRFSPLPYYYSVRPELEDDLLRKLAIVDTHDSLTDWYKHFRTPRQLQRTLTRLGLEEIYCVRGGNGVEARGKRPLSMQAAMAL